MALRPELIEEATMNLLLITKNVMRGSYPPPIRGQAVKKQDFYPKQVLMAMAGKDVQILDAAQRHVLHFFMRRSRKYGISVAAIQATKIHDLRDENEADFEAQASVVLSNCTTRIFISPANAGVPYGVFVDMVPFNPKTTA